MDLIHRLARQAARAVGVLRLREAVRSVLGAPSTLKVRAQVRGEVRRYFGARDSAVRRYFGARDSAVRRYFGARDSAVRRDRVDPITADVVTIIPTYRRPELLVQAVAAALCQDVADHAVLVVSDGEPVRHLLPADPRLHVVELAQNLGIAGAVRNVGIRISRSRVLAFLDDDNQWLHDHLPRLLRAIDDGADIAYSDLVRVLPDGRVFDVLARNFDRRAVRNENYVDINTIAMRRSRRVRFSYRRRKPLEVPGEDWVFVWRRSRRSTVVRVPAATVRYLINPGSYFWPGFAANAELALDSSGEPTRT